VGVFTLSNCNSNYNTAMGMDAMSGGITGNNNTGIGQSAMGGGTGGNNNTGIGAGSLYRHNKGDGNAALGVNSLTNDTSGIYNTALGFESMLSNKSGFQNTAVGTRSLERLATGFDNVAVGYYSTDSLTNGFRNTALGSYSLFRNKTSSQNTALGYYSLYNATSANNVAIGAFSMLGATTGSGNTGVGYNANVNAGTLVNTTAIGYFAATTASNQVRIGNSSVTSIGGFANWSNVSDGRIKKNIQANVPGLDFINKLEPVTYNLSVAAIAKITGTNVDNTSTTEKEMEEMLAANKAKEEILYSGFIAQDVEKAAKAVDYNFSGVDASKNNKDLYGLRYAEFVVPLVKAVQELSIKNDNLQKEVESLKALMENKENKTNVQLSSALLEQNVPNPFSESTTIHYTLPLKTTKAAIVITDKNGKKMKEINISGAGKGSVIIKSFSMNGDVYQYSLYVSGMLIDTKQMILSN
jgi:trimeric autotransporter adhesin